jgi:diguanylate cyclase (GGDEF)-like protein/PAS domain S-box-containing protein
VKTINVRAVSADDFGVDGTGPRRSILTVHGVRPDTAERLAELRRLRVLDTAPEHDFDLIAQTAAALFDAPIAVVALLDTNRVWLKAAHGTTARQIDLGAAFSVHAVEDPSTVMVVPDAALDERFRCNPLVRGASGIRFYAGAPLLSKSGPALGTLSVFDRKARTASDREIETLRSLAALTMRLIERRTDVVCSRADAETGCRDATNFITFDWDAEARIISWNRAAESAFGWTAGEVLETFPPFILRDDAQAYTHDCVQALAGAGDTTRLCTIAAKDDRLLQVAITVTRGVDADGRLHGISMVEDFGARLATERRLAMLESVVVNSTDAVVVTDTVSAQANSSRIIFVNDAFTRMSGYTAAEAIGNTPVLLQGPQTDPAEIARIDAALQLKQPVFVELTNYRKDGSPFRVEFSVSPICDRDGRCLHFVAIMRDVTQRRAREKYDCDRGVVLEMAVCNEPLEMQLNRIVVLLEDVIPGSRGTIMFVEGSVLVRGAADPRMPADYLAAIDRVPIGPRAGSCGTAVYERTPVFCVDIATDPRWERYRETALAAGLRGCWSMPLFGTQGDVIGAFALYTDRATGPTADELQFFEQTVRFASLVVERHRVRERLERLVLYDALTELPNRKLFEIRFAAAAARARAVGDVIAVGVLDIDRFKAVNDAYGHHVGDELLHSVAARLSTSLRDGDCVARMAGDEFLVMFPDLANQSDGAAAVGRLLAKFDPPFAAAGREIFVRPSLGLAFFPDTSHELLELLVAADKAMYAAKLRGGGIERATGAVTGSAIKKLGFENDLRHALERHEFELHYQVMFDLNDGRPVGTEALLRWHHSKFGTIPPGDFIPLAEANGTIVPIGNWVIDEASRIARGWQDEGRNAFVTVNVSALQFDEPGLLSTVVDALERHGLEPHRLHLELTESLIMRNPVASAAMLLQLRALGVRIVIDDFGTGYSSLAYLQQFAFDTLKIDRAFVHGIGDVDAGRSAQILSAVVALGTELGVTTIAEGVEEAAQYASVKACGCTIVQGFLCARPVAAQNIDWQPFDPAQNPRALA